MHSLNFYGDGLIMTLQTRIFVDFWNLQLTINEHTTRDYRLDWKKLSPCLIQEAASLLGAALQFEGTRVYISYNPNTPTGKGLHNWCINTLDRFAGIHVIAKERKVKSAPICPDCHQEIAACPHCQGQMIRTVEKGIDTAIVTDMIKLAWEDSWDVAVLVSSDRDFIPAVEFLTNKGRRVINACFPPQGIHLARKCWASINLKPHLDDLKR